LFRVRGGKPERWVRQTDFNNDEAVGYLADRLNRLGVDESLMKAGARSGDGVAIGPEENAVVFDWEPSVVAAAEMLGRRGEDRRLEAPRPAAQRRRVRQAERDEAEREYDGCEPFWIPRARRRAARAPAPARGARDRPQRSRAPARAGPPAHTRAPGAEKLPDAIK